MTQGFETHTEMSMKSKIDERRHWHDLYNDVLPHFSNESQCVSNNGCYLTPWEEQ